MSEERRCWICYATESESIGQEWVSPCACRGDTKWSHQKCLLEWIDKKENVVAKCPQCTYIYKISLPPSGN